MAETLDISDVIQPEYEPKHANQWVMNIDGLDTWTIRTSARPSFTIDEIEIPYINNRRYFPGRGAWEAIDIEILDVIAPSSAEKAMVWLRQIHNDETGQHGYRAAIVKQVVLILLGPANEVIEKWVLVNTWPTNINFGSVGLDYDAGDELRISMSLRFDYAKLIPIV